VTRNASKFEKIVYRASWRDLISAGSSMKEFFNSHSPLHKQPCWRRITWITLVIWLDLMWLDGLFTRFNFADWQKRELTRIRDLVLKDFPEVGAAASSELEYLSRDSYRLWFRGQTRSASISVSGRKCFPEALFHWDQSELFSFKVNDFYVLGRVLKRWLQDNALPSAMRKEFPWLLIGELADFYENGNPIEGEFIQSWNRIERFYVNQHFRLIRDLVLPFLAELRRAGYDRKFRAGHQVEMLVLSRSRRHGMRLDQPRVVFEFYGGTMDIRCKITEPRRQIIGIPIALSRLVEDELTKLANQPVD
jgi:hypothetical protein